MWNSSASVVPVNIVVTAIRMEGHTSVPGLGEETTADNIDCCVYSFQGDNLKRANVRLWFKVWVGGNLLN